MVKIENWSVVIESNGWTPPELLSPRLTGTVFGHSKVLDGTSVTTSKIVKTLGKKVVTYSGTTYELGEIDPEYLKIIKENGWNYDPENPVKLLTDNVD